MLKRLVASFVCFVLILSMIGPLSASANNTLFYDMEDYFVNESVVNGYTVRKYTINSTEHPYYRYEYNPYPSGTRVNKYAYGNTYSIYFSSVLSKLKIYSSLFQGSPIGNESSLSCARFDSIINHALYKGMDFSVTSVVKSTVDCTIQYCVGISEWNDSGDYNYQKRESSYVSKSLKANEEYYITAKANFANFPAALSVAVVPYLLIYMETVPTSGQITVTSSSFTCDVKLSGDQPDPPVLNTDLSGEFTYFRGDESSPFNVSASSPDGGALTYAWYYNTSKSTEGSTYCGNTASCYPSTSTVGTFYYYCVVTSTKGTYSSTTTSSFAKVNVLEPPQPPTITNDLSSVPVTYVQGDTADPLVISAISPDSGELSYQWYYSSSNQSSGGWGIGGATSASFIPSTSTVGTTYYYCVVTNTKGQNVSKIASTPACIQVIAPAPPASAPSISTNLNRSQVIYEKGDAAAALRISASVNDGGVLTYQWFSNTVQNNYGGTAIPGATGVSFTPDTVSVGTTYYYCVVTNSLNDTTASVSSAAAWITVQDPPPETIPPVLDEMNDKLDDVNNQLQDTNEKLDGVNDQLGDTNEKLDGVNDQLGDTNEKLDGVNDQLGDTNEKLDGVNDQLGDTNEKLEESNSLLGNIVQGILDLPQAILDGIKGLFVPDTETMAAYKDRWDELLASRFGAIYESIAIIDEFASSLRVYDQMNVIEFPTVNVNLAGTDWTFGGWVVDVIPEGFGFLVEILKKGVSVIATFAFLNAMRNKFEGILGGGKM